MRTITLAIVIFLAFVAEAMAEPRVQVTFHGKPENFTAWPPIPPHAFIEFQGVYREKPLKHRAFGFSFLEPPAGTLEYYLVGAKAVAAETAGTLRLEGRDYVDNPQNVSLTTFVDDDTFDLMIAEIENWRLYPPDYSLLSINCVGFVDRLARIAGLNTPPWRQVYPDNYVRELFRLNKDKLVCSPPLPEGARKEDIIDRWVTSRRPFVRTDHPAWLQNVILQGQSGVIGRTIDDLMKKHWRISTTLWFQRFQLPIMKPLRNTMSRCARKWCVSRRSQAQIREVSEARVAGQRECSRVGASAWSPS